FVALTLTPMLCAKILRVPQRHGRMYKSLERGFEAIASGYGRLLRRALVHPAIVVAGAVCTLLLAAVLFRSLEREFIPPEDRGFFPTFIIAPEGATVAYTNEYQRQVEAILARTADVEDYFSIGGFGRRPTRGIIFTRVTDWEDRERPVQEVLGELMPQFMSIPGVFVFASNPPAFGWGSPVQFVVQNPNFDSLAASMDAFTN